MVLKNKKSQSALIPTLLYFVIISSSLIIGPNLNMTGSAILSDTVIEKSLDIEVWADSFMNLSLHSDQNIFSAFLFLDNNTVLTEQHVEFYFNGFLIDSNLTDSKGHAEIFFNPNKSRPGTYFLEVIFQGNPALYLNPSSIKKQIEITEQNGIIQIRLLEEKIANETLKEILNQTPSLLSVHTNKQVYYKNETIEIFGEAILKNKEYNGFLDLEVLFNGSLVHKAKIEATNGNYNYFLVADFTSEGSYEVQAFVDNLTSQTSFNFDFSTILDLEGLICKEFTDNVLFSSGYTHNKKGSTNYETWEIKTNCTEAGGYNCSLYNINTKTRIFYENPFDEEITGEAYAQIAELDTSDCYNPEEEEYEEYVLYNKPSEKSDKKWERYCEKNKTQDFECEIEESENYYEESTCYGVKTFASQYSIVDVVEISYTWCWDESYGDNSKEKIKVKE